MKKSIYKFMMKLKCENLVDLRMEGEICSEEWEVVDYYYCYDDDDSCAKIEEEEKKQNWWWWWSGVGKKVVVTGVVISSAPVVIPPLLVVSALGFAMSLPFGVVFASYAATHKLMAKLLPPPPEHFQQEDYDDEGVAICNAVEIKNHIHEEDDDDDEGVAINNAVEIKNHIHEEEEDDEEEEVAMINNAVEIQNHIHEEEDDDEGVAINNAVEIKNLTQQQQEEKMSSEEDDIKTDGNIEMRIDIDGPNTTNHLQLDLHPESSSQNDNADSDEENSSKSGDQELDMSAEIKQLGIILMNDDDNHAAPLQSSKDAAPANKETVTIQVHHHTDIVGDPTPLKTAEKDVTTVVVAADDHPLELKEEKQSRQVNGGGLHSDHEQQGLNISDEKIWEKINAIRVIVGFKAPRRSSYVEELKALYLYTGIEPPPPSVADKLSFLMSVIGLK